MRRLTSKYLELWHNVQRLCEEKGLSAAVYTQLTDVETQCNGLLTYDRAVTKVDAGQVFASKYMHGQFPGLNRCTRRANRQRQRSSCNGIKGFRIWAKSASA